MDMDMDCLNREYEVQHFILQDSSIFFFFFWQGLS